MSETLYPWRAKCRAAPNPAHPPPITTTFRPVTLCVLAACMPMLGDFARRHALFRPPLRLLAFPASRIFSERLWKHAQRLMQHTRSTKIMIVLPMRTCVILSVRVFEFAASDATSDSLIRFSAPCGSCKPKIDHRMFGACTRCPN